MKRRRLTRDQRKRNREAADWVFRNRDPEQPETERAEFRRWMELDPENCQAYTAAKRILGELKDGTSRRRVGLKPEGKAPVRGHSKLFADAEGKTEIGEVTSGGFGPSVEGPVAMGYVPVSYAAPGTAIFAEVRGKYLPLTVAALPFIKPTYKR